MSDDDLRELVRRVGDDLHQMKNHIAPLPALVAKIEADAEARGKAIAALEAQQAAILLEQRSMRELLQRGRGAVWVLAAVAAVAAWLGFDPAALKAWVHRQ